MRLRLNALKATLNKLIVTTTSKKLLQKHAVDENKEQECVTVLGRKYLYK